MKKKLIYLSLSIVLIIASLVIFYKKYDTMKTDEKKAKIILDIHNKIQKEWLGKSILYPDSLYQIQNPNLSLKQHLKANDKDFILISYLNADCSDCIVELKNWDSFLKKKELQKKLEVFFIAESSDKENLSYQIINKAKFKDEVFYDVKSDFKNMNHLPETKAYQTFLVHKSKIVYLGSPAYGDKYVNDIENILLK